MKTIRIRCLILGILILGMIFPAASAEREIPDVLRVTQDIKITTLKHYQMITWSVLHSAREDVNDAINARVDALKEETEAQVPPGKDAVHSPPRGDICTQITRTGDRWMSFHIHAHASASNKQLWVKCEDYTYDMETGRLIRLGDIISEDGWETLIREIRTQVQDQFPGEEPAAEELDRICSRDALADAGFVMTPGHLALYYPAADLYPAHAEALLRVEIYVPGLREILTEEARQETDCSGYGLIALTYDDGPVKGRSREVLNASTRNPGQVTFFLIGHRLEKNAELLHLEYDSGHSVQSHAWTHEQNKVTEKKRAQWEELFDQAMSDIIGVMPTLMRPPGGNWKIYVNTGSEMPMILWNVNSQDVALDDSDDDLRHCYGCVIGAEDGDIILCHDANAFPMELAKRSMEFFEKHNMLLVTVDDLCALRGVTPEAGMTLKACPPEGGEE